MKGADLSTWFNLGKEKMHFWVICKAQCIHFPCLYCRASGRWWLQGAWGLSWKLGHLVLPSTVTKEKPEKLLLCTWSWYRSVTLLQVKHFQYLILLLLFLVPWELSASSCSFCHHRHHPPGWAKSREVPISCPVNAHVSANMTWKETQMGERRFREDLVGGTEN